VAIRPSKAALGQVAELLGTDRDSARIYLRQVQAAAGQVPYSVIRDAIQAAGTHEVEAVAKLIIDSGAGTQSSEA